MSDSTAIYERVKASFGPVAERYTVSIGHANPEALERVVRLARPLPTDRSLDVATGAGHTALALAPHVAEVVAYDLTASMLEEVARNAGRRKIRNVTPLLGAAEALPFEDGRFDIVTVRIAAHHFADIRQAIREMSRVARPGGRVVVVDSTVPEDDELDRQINRIERLRDPSHVRSYRPTEWRAMLTEAGLTVTSCEVDHYKEGGRMSFSAWTARIQTPPDARAELEMLFRNASSALRQALAIEVADSGISFLLPQVTLAAVKGSGG